MEGMKKLRVTHELERNTNFKCRGFIFHEKQREVEVVEGMKRIRRI